MSEIDDYRAQLQAKIDAIQKTEMERQQAHSDHSQKLNLPTPDAQFISQHIEQPAGLSEAEIKMQAYNQQQQEWMANMDDMVARHSQQPEISEMPDIELDDAQWEKDFAANQAALDEQDKKEKEEQERLESDRQKAAQLEAEKEEQRLADQQQQIDEKNEADRQAALATQAEQEKRDAAVNLEQAERSAPDDEISHNRALFEQAAARTNDHEIKID